VFHNPSDLGSEKGSGIVGFVLVAPLVVTIFIAIGQIAMLIADKSVLDSAATVAARAASAADASSSDGRSAALKVLSSRGSRIKPESIVIKQIRNQGIEYVSVSISQKIEIPFLGTPFDLTGFARAIDEASL
jgi:Flp pilus assembly protein TadG